MSTWRTNLQDADAVVDVLTRARDFCLNEAHREKSVVRLPARGRLVCTGDLHDNTIHLEKILSVARLDAEPDRHVYFHELVHGENLINGMDFSHRMLVRVAELKCAYPDQVHPILANHELSQFTGGGVSKGGGDSVRLFNDAIEWTFGEEADAVTRAVNEFLRAWPIAIMTESGLMCSHSLPSARVMDRFDPTILQRDLTEADYEPRAGSAYFMLWGRKHREEHLDRLAEMFGVEAFCLGHEHAEYGYKRLGRRAMILNSDHERGAVLPLDLARPPRPEDWPELMLPLGALS